jgi:N-methylhydantoinase A
VEARLGEIEAIFAALEEEAGKTLMKDGTGESIRFERSLDMRFVGQGAETNIPAPAGPLSGLGKAEIRRLFDNVYERLYGRTYPDSEVEFINFKVRAVLPEKLLQLPKFKKKRGQTIEAAVKGTRKAYSPTARDFIPHTVYDRYKLFPGAAFRGPAIIEERESTVIVGEKAQVRSDEFGFLRVDLKEA